MNSFVKKIFLATVPLCLTASVVQAAEFQTLDIKLKTSHYMDMKKRVTRIAVGDPSVATAVQLPGSATEFLIVTKGKGSTTLFVWTADGARYEYLIVVSPEDPGQAMMIEKAIGLPDVHVKFVDNRLLLTGTVENQYEKNYALQTARLFINAGTESSLLVGSGFDMKLETSTATDSGRSEDVELSKSETAGQIIDLLQILRPTQIRFEAQIIEISSDAARDLGLQYGINGSGGTFGFGESYNRSNTSISESSSSNWSSSYSGGGSNSYSDSYSSSSSSSGSNSSSSSSDDGSSSSSSSSSGYDSSTSRSNSGNGSDSYSGGSSFGRTVTSTWDGLRTFSNNPIKWITQHFAPINVTLTALVNSGKAKVLSRPTVMTLSGEQATIQIGGQIPYSTTNSNGTNTQFKDYGIILQVKPVVDAQKRINSAIHAEVSNISGETGDGQPILSTRSADSVVSLGSGMPIVIGGLIDSSETKRVLKIPLLGDIPIIGEFFKHTSKSRDKRELIIVVTPYLVEEEEISRSPMSQPMREWYEQQEQQRKAMENHDFKPPEPEVVIEEEEPKSILPPANYPKNGKTTDTPFK